MSVDEPSTVIESVPWPKRILPFDNVQQYSTYRFEILSRLSASYTAAVKVKGRSAVGHDTDMIGHLGGIALAIVEGLRAETATLHEKPNSRITVIESSCGLLIMILISPEKKRITPAFSCGAQSAFKLKERSYLKHAIAPSAARLCSRRR